MKDKDTLTIYWSSLNYNPNQKSWSMLYREPESLSSLLRRQKTVYTLGMFACPASNDFLKNIFVFKSNIDDEHIIPVDYLSTINSLEPYEEKDFIETNGKISMFKTHPASIEGYTNLTYNMSWALFADEPVVCRFTAPYMPHTTPGEGVILSSGKFDIGQWYRSFFLDYHIPLTTNVLKFKENDPLFYLEVETDKKIEFKRYFISPKLHTLSEESVNAPFVYGRWKSLKQRYEMASKTKYREQVLSEIKKNVVE
jgi:hypothetical protein